MPPEKHLNSPKLRIHSVKLSRPEATMSATIPLGIALLAKEESMNEVYCLYRSIHQTYPSSFVLENEGVRLPHLSLFQGRFAEDRIDQMIDVLHGLFVGQKPMEVSVEGLSIWAGAIVFLDIVVTKELKEWHEALVEKIAPLLMPKAGPADPQTLSLLSQEEQRSMEAFAYPFALDAFRPHFTLGRASQDSLLDSFAVPPQVTFNRVVLFQVGQYGSLEKILYTRNLIIRA